MMHCVWGRVGVWGGVGLGITCAGQSFVLFKFLKQLTIQKNNKRVSQILIIIVI